MGIEIQWDDPANPIILIQTFTHPWTIQDLTSAIYYSHFLIENSSQTIHLVSVLSHAIHLAPNMIAIANCIASAPVPANEGIHVLVTQGSIFSIITPVFRRIIPHVMHKMYVAHSLEDARHLVHHHIDSASRNP